MAPPGFEPGSAGLKGPYNDRYTKEPFESFILPYPTTPVNSPTEDRTPISGMKARYTSHYTIGP
jgi:hypothetical protein